MAERVVVEHEVAVRVQVGLAVDHGRVGWQPIDEQFSSFNLFEKFNRSVQLAVQLVVHVVGRTSGELLIA